MRGINDGQLPSSPRFSWKHHNKHCHCSLSATEHTVTKSSVSILWGVSRLILLCITSSATMELTTQWNLFSIPAYLESLTPLNLTHSDFSLSNKMIILDTVCITVYTVYTILSNSSKPCSALWLHCCIRCSCFAHLISTFPKSFSWHIWYPGECWHPQQRSPIIVDVSTGKTQR